MQPESWRAIRSASTEQRVNGASDPITLALTGAVPFMLLASTGIALPLSLWLLRSYRRAVLRGMNQAAGASAQPAPAPAMPSSTPAARLEFATLSARPGVAAALPGPSPWRVAVSLAIAIAFYAAVMTAAWLLATQDDALGAVKLAVLFWSYFWPAVLVVNLVAATDRATRFVVAAVYFVFYVLLAGIALARSPTLTPLHLAQHWLVTNGPPTLLLAAFLARRIRAVGPMVLAFTLLALFGSAVAAWLVGASDETIRAAVAVGGALGLGGRGTFWLTLALGLTTFGVAAWFALRALGAHYAAKRFSDEMLTVDAIMLIFAVTQSIGLVFNHWAWIGSGPVAYLAFRAAATASRRRLPRVEAPRRLLLLRVFAVGARSEPLFDALRRRWLRAGSIALIAGPDLVTSTVEPDEFLAFLSGRLQRTFVASEADLAARLAAMDRGPDPDGRFRVNEFFCRADTWQATMQRLVAESDAVLMDLRSFGPSNQGCLFELGRLLDAIDLRRVVFVIDRSTDAAFLRQALSRLWSNLAADSPNRTAPEPAARLLEISGPTAAESRALVGHLAAD